MSSATRTAVECSRHISLAGALAVGLGIGAGVIAGPWTASASPAEAGTSSVSDTASRPDRGPSAVPRTSARDHRDPADSPGARRRANRSDGDTDVRPRWRPFRAADTQTNSNDTAPVSLSLRRLPRAQSPVADADPSNTRSPDIPADGPTAFTLLALSRRDTEESANALGRNGVRPPVAERLVATGGSTDPVPADTITAPAVEPPVFTGRPSLLSKTLSAVFGAVGKIGTLVHADLTLPLTGLLQSDHPPRRTMRGLTVERTEFEGMPVWTLQSVRSTSEKAVVAVHGGALSLQPTVFNWLFYSAMARKTGATVVVPLYPLVPEGTAREVVPAVADLITTQIDQRGAPNVSVFGDSSGGNIVLVAVQELVRRGDAIPSRMVLSAPGVDSTLSNPAIALVDDPLFTPEVLADVRKNVAQWADGLDLTDPLLSPLFGSLEGLPPTAVYVGSRDVVAPDLLLLREKAAATPGADFTFVLREGELHDWAIFTIFPETRAVLPDIYRQLGIA